MGPIDLAKTFYFQLFENSLPNASAVRSEQYSSFLAIITLTQCSLSVEGRCGPERSPFASPCGRAM